MAAAPARASDWSVIKYAGRDHVSLENISEFYGLNRVVRARNNVTIQSEHRSIRASAGSPELFINGIKFILSYPVAEYHGDLLITRMDLSKLIEPVLRPNKIKNAENVQTVVLDPGHGGHDMGATCAWGAEKDFALAVARQAKLLLESAGYNVVMTRDSDVFVPLEARTAFANRFDNALFISIHFNSGNGAATGVETYTLAPRGVPSMAADGPRITDLQGCAGNARDSENMALATATHAALVSQSGMYDRGIKRARFVVIRDVKIPGVLIEGGFLSNRADSRRIAGPAYRQQMARCIALAVANYKVAVSGETQQPRVLVREIEGVKKIGETASLKDEPRVIIPRAE